MGTAGSLQFLPPSITQPFPVMNGDVLTRLAPNQLLRFHQEHKASATLCVREHEIAVPYGVVETNGIDLEVFKEKPIYKYLVNAGVYTIDPTLLTLLPHNQYTDMPTFLELAQQSGHRVAVFPIHEYWLDVGMPETMREAHDTWSNSQVRVKNQQL